MRPALAAAVLLIAGLAAAHQPTEMVEGRMLALGVPGWSWSIDGVLEDGDDVDWIRIPYDGRLEVDLLVPAGEGAREVPGEGALPPGVSLAPGEGAVVARTPEPEGEVCHLGFCWLERGRLSVEGQGVAHLAVHASADRGGPYTIAIGGAEGMPPVEPRLLPDPGRGEPASAVAGTGGPASFPGVLDFFGQNAHAPHGAWWLGLVVYGVPALVIGLALYGAGRLLGRRGRAV